MMRFCKNNGRKKKQETIVAAQQFQPRSHTPTRIIMNHDCSIDLIFRS
jgi:hypothetical protein